MQSSRRDPVPSSRNPTSAARAIDKFKPAALTSQAGAILGMLMDSDAEVRYDALHMVDSDTLGMLEPNALALACSAVTNMLTDEWYDVRYAAAKTKTLANLKRKRALLHWATARVFVHMYLVRPYVLFWHTYVGARLCAPGGKWAERDRVAFEEEF